MTILTFNFSESYRAVSHTSDTYSQFHGSETLTGWNNKAFKIGIANVVGSSGGDYKWDITGGYHYEDSLSAYGVGSELALKHSPTAHHYDLWNPYGDPLGLYLRVNAEVPPPPVWADYVQPTYYGDEGAVQVAADSGLWEAAFKDWQNEAWLFQGGLGGEPVPRTEATLWDDTGKLGVVESDSPISPQEFLDITNYQTVVDGSKHDDTIEGGKFDDTLSGAGGNDLLSGLAEDDILFGQEGNDWLTGGRGIDVLRGGAGNDTLDGGLGLDALKGGVGRDWFVFTNRINVDKVEDFTHGTDKIVLLAGAFPGLPSNPTSHALAASAFHVGPQAADANDRIIYWQGTLYYDADGNKNGDHGFQEVPFATIENVATLTYHDFLIYSILPLG